MSLPKIVHGSQLIVNRFKKRTTNHEPALPAGRPPTMNHNSAGFTLIELLVVISIIGLLVGVATVSYSNVQQKSRDGKRKADLAAISQVLARFYDDNGAYPMQYRTGYDAKTYYMSCDVSGDVNGYVPAADKIDWGTSFKSSTSGTVGSGCNGSKTYMTKVPDDSFPHSNSVDDHGYIYAIYQYKYHNDGSGNEANLMPGAPQGWCRDTGLTNGSAMRIVDKCQHYTLWTTLENEKDPDIQKTLADPICKVVARYGGLGSNPSVGSQTIPPSELEWYGEPSDHANPGYWADYWTTYGGSQYMTKGWAYWAYEDPDSIDANLANGIDPPTTTNGYATRNYCIHDSF